MAERERLFRTIDLGLEVNTWVTGLCWSPDGSRFVVGTGSTAGNVQVLTAEGRQVWRTRPFDNQVHGLAWSPDGTRIAVGSHVGPLVILDSATGSVLLRVAGVQHNGGVAWSPDSSRIAALGSEQQRAVWLIDAESGRIQHECRPDVGRPWGVAWSPSGDRIAVGLGSSIPGWIIDAGSGARVLSLADTAADEADVLRWSPDGTRILLARTRPGWTICSAETGARLAGCEDQAWMSYGVDWSPDGRVVASCGRGFGTGDADYAIGLWDSSTGHKLAGVSGHTEIIYALAFAPDGKFLASLSRNRGVHLWDVSDLCGEPAKPAATWATGADGAYLARQLATVGRRPTAAPTKVPIGSDSWVPTGLPGADPATGCLGVMAGVALQVFDLYPDGRHLFGGVKGTSRWAKWNLATGRQQWEVAGPEVEHGEVAAVSPDGTQAAVAARNTFGWASRTDGGPLARCAGSDSRASRALAWSPDGRTRAWSSYSQYSIFLQDVASGDWLGECQVPSGSEQYYSLHWAAAGNHLAAGLSSNAGVAVVWDSESRQVRWVSASVGGRVWDIRFRPDGHQLAILGNDQVTIADSDTGAVRARTPKLDGWASNITWSPDGRHVVILIASRNSPGGKRELRVFDAPALRQVARFHVTSRAGARICWSSGGGFLAAGCEDGVRLFDVRHLMPAAAAVAAAAPAAAVPGLRLLPAARWPRSTAGPWPPLSAVADAVAAVAGRPPAGPGWHAAGGCPACCALRPLLPPARPLAAVLLADVLPPRLRPSTRPPASRRPASAWPWRASSTASADFAPAKAHPSPGGRRVGGPPFGHPGGRLALIAAAGPAACALDPSPPLRLAARACRPWPGQGPPAAGLTADTRAGRRAGAAAAGGGWPGPPGRPGPRRRPRGSGSAAG